MDWIWTASALAAVAVGWLLWQLRRAPEVDEERCPYRFGTDRIDCLGPCELKPPCHYL